jgi:hypothetical protein
MMAKVWIGQISTLYIYNTGSTQFTKSESLIFSGVSGSCVIYLQGNTVCKVIKTNTDFSCLKINSYLVLIRPFVCKSLAHYHLKL